MEATAGQPYEEPESTLPDAIASLSYDQHRAINFRTDHALWRNEPVDFQLQAFHPGWIFENTTKIFIGDDGVYDLHRFNSGDFAYRSPLDPEQFEDIQLDGVAGFRLHTPLQRPDYFDELVTFLGASYFRALGAGTRYGLSARGLAINTATGQTEEFPRFSAFYIEQPEPGEASIRIMAELHSPSLTGAYAFTVTPGLTTTIDVTCRLYFRSTVDRLGIAPLTSMFAYGENDRSDVNDFRPEVHDSDGLFIELGNGERCWRPLQNPTNLCLSFIQDDNPSGFGLIQRDRDFSHYADLEARYDLRPDLLIEPLGEWGRGAVELVEIPTDSEVNDNIVAFWVPRESPEAGGSMEFSYRMHWGTETVAPSTLASVGATYIGVGGNAAFSSEDQTTRRFAIDFSGGNAANLGDDAQVEAVVNVSDSANLVHTGIARLPDGGWRVALELERNDSRPSELRVKLSYMNRVVSETWLYQWTEDQ